MQRDAGRAATPRPRPTASSSWRCAAAARTTSPASSPTSSTSTPSPSDIPRSSGRRPSGRVRYHRDATGPASPRPGRRPVARRRGAPTPTPTRTRPHAPGAGAGCASPPAARSCSAARRRRAGAPGPGRSSSTTSAPTDEQVAIFRGSSRTSLGHVALQALRGRRTSPLDGPARVPAASGSRRRSPPTTWTRRRPRSCASACRRTPAPQRRAPQPAPRRRASRRTPTPTADRASRLAGAGRRRRDRADPGDRTPTPADRADEPRAPTQRRRRVDRVTARRQRRTPRATPSALSCSSSPLVIALAAYAIVGWPSTGAVPARPRRATRPGSARCCSCAHLAVRRFAPVRRPAAAARASRCSTASAWR